MSENRESLLVETSAQHKVDDGMFSFILHCITENWVAVSAHDENDILILTLTQQNLAWLTMIWNNPCSIIEDCSLGSFRSTHPEFVPVKDFI